MTSETTMGAWPLTEKSEMVFVSPTVLTSQITVDDFGTGYSTLGYLAHFSFAHLKIDQKLAPNITSDPEDAAIVAGIITIGNNLGMQVIAEGVETLDQLSFFETQGCFDFQGWYYSRSVDADQITEFLEQGTLW